MLIFSTYSLFFSFLEFSLFVVYSLFPIHFLISLVWFLCFNGIDIWRLSNDKAILLEEQWGYYLTHSWEDKGVHTFPKGICAKVNVIARLEYELTYYDSTVIRYNHYTTGTPSLLLEFCSWFFRGAPILSQSNFPLHMSGPFIHWCWSLIFVDNMFIFWVSTYTVFLSWLLRDATVVFFFSQDSVFISKFILSSCVWVCSVVLSCVLFQLQIFCISNWFGGSYFSAIRVLATVLGSCWHVSLFICCHISNIILVWSASI